MYALARPFHYLERSVPVNTVIYGRCTGITEIATSEIAKNPNENSDPNSVVLRARSGQQTHRRLADIESWLLGNKSGLLFEADVVREQKLLAKTRSNRISANPPP